VGDVAVPVWSLKLPGPLVVNKSARSTSKHCWHYNPNAANLARVSGQIRDLVVGLDGLPLDCPIRVSWEFGVQMPKLSARRSKELLGKPVTKRPDLTNYVKFYEDAANGVLWADDKVIAESKSVKIYSLDSYVEIKIEVLDGKRII